MIALAVGQARTRTDHSADYKGRQALDQLVDIVRNVAATRQIIESIDARHHVQERADDEHHAPVNIGRVDLGQGAFERC